MSAINELDADNIEREVADFAASPSGGLIVTASALSVTHLELIVALAAKYTGIDRNFGSDLIRLVAV